MIDELNVESLALIRNATLLPSSGLTVLTGETGAGKTALLSACKLLMGERGDAAQVRTGEDAACVRARMFFGAHDVEGTVVERRLSSDGRSRVRLNGVAASVRELNELIRPHIDLCGQHEHQKLLSSSTQLHMVDAWAHASIGPLLADYQSALAAARAAEVELDRVVEAAGTQGARLDDARFVLQRIQEVNPCADEYEELEQSLPRAEHAEALACCAQDARSALADEHGALDALNTALVELGRMRSVDATLGEFEQRLREAAIMVEDCAAELRAYRDSVEFDPAALEQAQSRMSELKGLLRAYGPTMDDVFSHKAAAEELLALVDDGQARIAEAQKRRDEAEGCLRAVARDLNQARAVAGPRFCREVTRQMSRLEMGRAELVWDMRELPRERWNESGPATCELLYKSGPSMTPRPLRRIASGGELSRVTLAAKVVLGGLDSADTLVFDEVDAGVGGAVAKSLARVLSDLAHEHQVIVVTHLPQVAVMADTHYVVVKSQDDQPETKLVQVAGDERIKEIARMLSGDATEVSLAHAQEMLEEAGTL